MDSSPRLSIDNLDSEVKIAGGHFGVEKVKT